MTAGRLLLWRHGRTAYNSQARLQGGIDIPLDDVGRWQARTAAALLLARYEPTHVLVSDLGRAQETAGFLTRAAGLEPVVDARVRERHFGEWEGLTGDEITERWADQYAVWRAGGDPEGVGAETRAAVSARVGAGVAEHAAALTREDTLVVVSHGTAIGAAVAALLGMPHDWHAMAGMHNAHWADLVSSRRDVAPAWRLTGYNLGPTGASSDWNAGPDTGHGPGTDDETRDPD